ncbi:alpha/beta fold hydrolase [Gryllotalpicola ginsengisoli]|uniref:alpha/beta fold hydrolase n=1 Tax=Gryllotalpicola ginsengisoli TaxID=444608 RepID=UPI0003F95C7F|nr:alpha/beta fold hydrolase [Gryllotalpicola ginsengisoli]
MTAPELHTTDPAGPDGAPLLVLGPSLGTSTLLWDDAAAILRRSFRVTAWDLPGHGLSPAARAPFTVAELADAVAGLLDELGEQRAYYAGVSLGGAVGLELALRHPSRVIALADVCSAAKIGTPESWHERAAQVRTQGTAALVISSAQRWFAPGSIERHPVVSGRLLHALRDADDESYALCCEALAGFDVRPRLGEIAVPVQVIWGEHDVVISHEAADEVASGVQRGALIPITDAAHLAPAEQPEAVASALAELPAEVRG